MLVLPTQEGEAWSSLEFEMKREDTDGRKQKLAVDLEPGSQRDWMKQRWCVILVQASSVDDNATLRKRRQLAIDEGAD
jgi:hypothetical protein